MGVAASTIAPSSPGGELRLPLYFTSYINKMVWFDIHTNMNTNADKIRSRHQGNSPTQHWKNRNNSSSVNPAETLNPYKPLFLHHLYKITNHSFFGLIAAKAKSSVKLNASKLRENDFNETFKFNRDGFAVPVSVFLEVQCFWSSKTWHCRTSINTCIFTSGLQPFLCNL